MKQVIMQGLENVPGARQIREEVFVQEQGYMQEFDEIDATAWHILITDDEQPIAAGRVYFDDDSWHMGHISVRKGWRGRGIGKMVVGGLEEKVKELGGGRFLLSAQLHAQKFYESMGYQAFGKTVLDEGQPHIMMEKQV